MRRASRAVAVAAALAALSLATAAHAGTVTTEQHQGRNVRVFVPTTVASPAALVVMLHGCTQTADAFADATKMDALAEAEGFVVAYPEQSPDTVSTRCFRWYEPAHQARDAGEPKELADSAGEIVVAHGLDAQHVYVAGMSAGGAMAVILGATYPDRFAAIGVVAGLEYKAATSLSSGLSAPQSGGPDPQAQGALAFAAMGANARVMPVLSVHGTADGVVNRVNGQQVVAQWRRTNELALGAATLDPPVSVTGTAGYAFTHAVHRETASQVSVIESYVVDGLGHAWPGGKSGGSYSDPRGPDASALLWGFFEGRTVASPLGVPPVVLDGGTADGGGRADGGGSSGAGGAGGGEDGGAGGDDDRIVGNGTNSDGGCAIGATGASSWALVTAAGLVALLRRRRRR